MRILVAVGGGAAAMKAPFIVRRLLEAGYEVRALLTEKGRHFTTEHALALVSGGEVATDARWFAPEGRALHLELADWADLVLVAPATARILAQAAQGLADDLLGALLIAGVKKLLLAPAMNSKMWADPRVQAHVEALKAREVCFAGPTRGAMAARGETSGEGRMLEPEELVEYVGYCLAPKDFAGRTLVISAGPTREYLDPVRFLSNPSSGRMGYALAAAARDRGAEVILVSGPTALPRPFGVRFVPVERALEMRDAVLAHAERADAVIMAAAVADWRPERTAEEKEAKGGEEKLLRLVANPDILAELGRQKGSRILVGFAMETAAGLDRAYAKLKRKKLDLIALNRPTNPRTAFGGLENQVVLIYPDGRAEASGIRTKREIADWMLDRLLRLMQRSV